MKAVLLVLGAIGVFDASGCCWRQPQPYGAYPAGTTTYAPAYAAPAYAAPTYAAPAYAAPQCQPAQPVCVPAAPVCPPCN